MHYIFYAYIYVNVYFLFFEVKMCTCVKCAHVHHIFYPFCIANLVQAATGQIANLQHKGPNDVSFLHVHECVLLTQTHNIPRRGLGMLRESYTHSHTDTNKSHRERIQDDCQITEPVRTFTARRRKEKRTILGR